LPLEQGLLIGAVLAPTDPAILVPLFDRIRVRRRLAETIIAESAINDPTGAVLALALAAVVLGGDASVGHSVVDFAGELALSTAFGLVAGVALSFAVSSRRPGIWRESAPIACLTVVAVTVFGLDAAGGSGYLGAFVAGLVVANMHGFKLQMHSEHERELRSFVDSLADVAGLVIFLVLGASLPLQAIADNILACMAVVATLVLVARPIVIVACLTPDRRARWTRPELAFLAATRETGVMPAALAGVLVGMGVPNSDLVTACVAVTVLVTLGFQATTKPWLVRRLGLAEEPTAPPGPVAEPEPAAASPA
jgi:cell volume regulation protein A